MPKITVITAVYNTLPYLDICFSSVINQTVPVHEFIIVDDGSTDGSGEFIDEFAQKHANVKVIHQTNAGQAAARNAALNLASGEYTAFIDSDDWYDLDFLENLVNICQKENADIACATMKNHYPNGIIIEHKYEKQTNPFRITPSVCNKIFSAKLIGKTKFQENLWYEDFGFFHAILTRNPHIVYSDNTAYNCHCREISTMSNNNALKNLDILKICDYILSQQQTPLLKEIEEEYTFIFIDTLIISTINRVAAMKNKDKAMVIKEIRAYVYRHFPNWEKNVVFQKMPLKRRIIAKLNAHSLHNLSHFLLSLKPKITKLGFFAK